MMARLYLLLPIAWRSLWRNPRRTIITMLVVSVGLWSIIAFAVLFHAWAASSRDTTLKLMTGEAQIHAPGYRDDPTIVHRMAPPKGALAALLNSPKVAAYAERVRVGAIVQSEYKTLPITLTGVVPQQERKMSVLPSQITAGHYLKGPDDIGIVLGRDLARRLKTRVGKRVVVLVQNAKGKLAERAFSVIGLFSSTQEAEDEFAFTGIQTAQAFTGSGHDISEISLDSSSDKNLPALMTALRNAAPMLDIQSWKTLAPLAFAMTTFFGDFVMIWLAMMVPLIAVGIVNTQLTAVFERRREFGLLQALGMRPRQVVLDVALESAFLIGIGVLIGLTAAMATVQAFHNGLDLGFLGRGAEYLGAGHILYPRIDVGEFAFYGVVVWALSMIATLWPAWRASKVSPVEAMARA